MDDQLFRQYLSIPVATDEQYTVAQRWKGLREAIQFFAQCTEIAVPLDFNRLGFEGGDDFSIQAATLFFRLAFDHL